MLFRLITIQGGNKHAAWLYAVVFRTRISALLVILLCLSFLVQPISQVYAAEEEEATTEPESTPAESVVFDEPSSVNETQEAEQPESVEDDSEVTGGVESTTAQPEVSAELKKAAATEEANVVASTATNPVPKTTEQSGGQTTAVPSATESSAGTTDSSASSNKPVSVATTTPQTSAVATSSSQNSSGSISTTPTPVPTDAPTSSTNQSDDTLGTDETQTPDPEPVNVERPSGSSSNNEPEQDSEVAEPEVASTTPQVETVREISYLITEENYYQFSKQSCVPVGDGTFHCSVDNVSEPDSNAVVFARMGDSGTQEIFIRTKRGEEEQITDNKFDDTAPQYDAASKQIVWQRNIDGRYQIILYDLVTERESQLTFSRTNNMEPSVSLSGIVWQAWDGNDWEVMYYDGTYTDQITDNQSQDIGPTIEDGYILWSVPGNETQEARVYSLENKETLSVRGHEGGSIANPRFVLVYDTRFDNGDVVTQSFDPDTGIATPIAAKAAPDPIDIPAPDPIGEIRALIQNKSTEDDLVKKASTSTATTGTSTPALDADPDTLVLQTDQADTPVATASTSQEVPFELDEYDLVITPEGVSTTSATSTQP